MEKTSQKNTTYSRNETTLKIGRLAKAIARAKAIAYAKWSVWVKNVLCNIIFDEEQKNKQTEYMHTRHS